MTTIANTYLPQKQKVSIALQQIYGIGPYLSFQICDQLGFSSNLKIEQLNRNQIEQLSLLVSQSYTTGSKLKRSIQQDMSRLISISCYRGFRYIQKLPVRGQRTHTNAKTARKRMPVIGRTRKDSVKN